MENIQFCILVVGQVVELAAILKDQAQIELKMPSSFPCVFTVHQFCMPGERGGMQRFV
jgi:hypothetical protein